MTGVLRERAPAKINLCLLLGPTREHDGRHELVSIMQSVTLADELTLEPAGPDAAGDEVVCPGVPGDNLAAAALAAFRAATGWSGPPQRLTIVKRVPVAAGMGGGSGDAAAALRLAARAAGMRNGELPRGGSAPPGGAAQSGAAPPGGGAASSGGGAAQSGAAPTRSGGAHPAAGATEALLLRLAADLGADVPAQVRPGRSLAAGAGERVLHLPDGPPFGLLVLPGAGALSTAAVYAEADRQGLARAAAALAAAERDLAAAPDLAAAELVNDLQPAARALAPAIDEALAAATAAGADVAMVSGSGPTVLGLFRGAAGPARARAAAEALADRRPAPLVAGPEPGWAPLP